MDEVQVIEIGREAIVVLLKISAPIMLVSLGVGLLVSLFQALTQIQEATLSFVPKMLAIFATILIFTPYIINELTVFTEHLNEKIIALP